MHKRRIVFFGGGIVLVVALVAFASIAGGPRTSRTRPAVAAHDVPAFATPCGGTSESLDEAQAQAPYRIMMPDHPLANEGNLTAVWDCPADGVLLQFGSGVTVFYDVSTIADPERGWQALAHDNPNVYSTARVRGQMASLTVPSKTGEDAANGGVTLVEDGLFIAVGGDGSTPLGKMVAVAESLR